MGARKHLYLMDDWDFTPEEKTDETSLSGLILVSESSWEVEMTDVVKPGRIRRDRKHKYDVLSV